MSSLNNTDKFNGNKPLESWWNNYPAKYEIKYYGFEEPKIFDLRSIICKGKIDTSSIKTIIFGIKAKLEEFEKYDFLRPVVGPAFVVHQRVLDKFNESCPNDIQALPIIIKNLDPTGEQFENNNFYLINVLNKIDMLDETETIFVDEDGKRLTLPENVHFKTIDYMQNHLLVREKICVSSILFHPSLGKHFKKSKGINFLTDEESLEIRPYRTELWFYLNRFYDEFLLKQGVYDDFFKPDGFKKAKEIAEKYKDQIFINYCPNCGNLKKTPQARQCLKCGQFHDPKLV